MKLKEIVIKVEQACPHTLQLSEVRTVHYDSSLSDIALQFPIRIKYVFVLVEAVGGFLQRWGLQALRAIGVN